MTLGKAYHVTDGEPRHRRHPVGWCGVRFLVIMSVICCTIIYLIGAIITGITYRTYGLLANCTDPRDFTPVTMYAYTTPLVVVGPCFMSAGGSILIFLLFQWCFCRPGIN
ncbi:uncharacterized protein [Procambarus clarkii]|uniref:uncharacterized protein n=1 Tax=Procambarus clarkii TaxID=6728 RepID=UPI001E677106|nr:uncharacterized protein LOC123748346 [Procambarus clarkii]